ncbi:MAG: Clp protease ClpP [Bacteroidales bacterium]|nr:Clp protease ClpP [Bacteroidales bacterium]
MKVNGNKAYIGDITAFPLSEYPEFETQTSANQMIDFLQSNGDVELYINSQGGDVFEAMQIYNELRRHSRNHSVKVYVDGLSASAASYLMFGGSELFVPKNATIMIHKPTTWVWGNADELQSGVNALNAIQSNIETIYADNAKNISAVQIRHLVDATTWMTGSDFADKFKCTLIDELPEDKAINNKVLIDFKARVEFEDKRRKDIANLVSDKPNDNDNGTTTPSINWNINRKVIF